MTKVTPAFAAISPAMKTLNFSIAKVNRRLHLFYLANDVVQSCKKKNAKIYLLAFKNVLKDAVVLVRDASIKHKIERLFHIWEERNTYFIDFVNELRELLNDREKVTAHVSATNFKPQAVLESIRKVKMLEAHVGMKQKQVENLKLDASKIEAVKQLKDRSHSHDFAKQFDDSFTKMQAYVKLLENEISNRGKLVELLENGQTFYEVQNDDAMVVANAYRNFGIRINNLKKRLVDYKDTLTDDADSPIPSPSAEAPSPGNTPPQMSADDQTEEMDMELSDSEETPSGEIIAAEAYTPSGSNSLTDRLAAMVSTLPVASTDPRQAGLAEAGGYSPADQLQREKSGAEAGDKNILFSMVAAKAQPASIRSDKSVLKNLTDFAEKVKNPPPKDWSEFNRKRIEKAQQAAAEQAAAEQAARQAAAEEAARRALAERAAREAAERASRQAILEQEQAASKEVDDPTARYSPAEEAAQFTTGQHAAKQTASNQTPQAASNSVVTSSQPLASGNIQSSPRVSYSITSSAVGSSQSQTSLPSTSVTNSVEGEEDGRDNSISDGLHSISWPPRNFPPVSASPRTMPGNRLVRPPPPHQSSPTLQRVRPSMPPAVRPVSYGSHIPRRTLAPHIRITDPLATKSPIRHPTKGIVTVCTAPPPPPPTSMVRTISSEQQQDALQLLDSIHAETANNDSAITESVPENQGNPIQTLGYNISPVVNRINPATRTLTRPPIPPNFTYNNHRPPAKRPYQDYGNYPYYY